MKNLIKLCEKDNFLYSLTFRSTIFFTSLSPASFPFLSSLHFSHPPSSPSFSSFPQEFLCLAFSADDQLLLLYPLLIPSPTFLLSPTSLTLPFFPVFFLQEFLCLAFSADDQLLLSVSGAPDWKLTFWSWGKAQVVAECQVQ